MFESQDTEDPTCVIKMLDEFRQCNPTVNRPNFIDMAVVPTILQFDDCVVSHDSKKRKHTDSNVSVDTAEDSNISVLGKFEIVFQMYSDSSKLLPLFLVQ